MAGFLADVNLQQSTTAAGGPSRAVGGANSAPFTVGGKGGTLTQNLAWALVFAGLAAAATWIVLTRWMKKNQ